jgi:hypothetical protein
LNVGDASNPHFLNLPIRGYTWSSNGSFNGIWSDMGTEETIIKDLKGSGGIVGIASQKSAHVIF